MKFRTYRLLPWLPGSFLLVALTTFPADAQRLANLLQGIKAPPGFDVTLFAAPPNISYPVCLAASPSGELFVGVDENGSLGTKTNRGRIVRCVDTNGDGRADEFKVFANVESPRGLYWDDGALYVLHPPFLHAYHDDDGDGVADRSEQLLDGLGFTLKTRGADHTINGIRMGIDGWIYIAAGDYGFVKATGKDGRVVQLLGGGVARVRPDGTELEIFAHGLRNIYDVAVDPLLDLFTRDNTNDGGGWDVRLSHIFSGAHYGYPTLFKNFSNEIVQPLADYGGGSPTGSLFLSEPGFPDDLGNSLYTCEWGRSMVYRHPLKPNSAGFSAQQVPFLTIPRPTDMDVDGQSRIYVSSWKDGGFDFSKPDIGFVVRVTPSPAPKVPTVPDFRKASERDLLGYLGSPSHVWRLQTQREMLRRGPLPNLVSGLEKLAQGKGVDSLPVRVAALFTLKQLLGTKSHATILRLAQDDSFREFCLRALADRTSQVAELPVQPFANALRDSNARVRLQAVIALGRIGKSEVAETLVAATEDPDPLVRHAAINALVALHAVDAILAAVDYRPTSWTGAFQALQQMHDPRVVDGLLQRLHKSTNPGLARRILTALCRLHYREAEYTGNWWGTRPDTTGPYFKPVEWGQTDRIYRALAEQLHNGNEENQKFLLAQMARHRIRSEETTSLILKFADRDPAFVPTAITLLASRSGISSEFVPLFARVAVSSEYPPATRARAISSLQRSSDAVAFPALVAGLTSASRDSSEEIRQAREQFIRDPRNGRNLSNFVALARSDDPARRELAYATMIHLAGQRQRETQNAASAALEPSWSRAEDLPVLLKTVGQAKAQRFAPQVRAHLTDSDPVVRKQAEYAALELKLEKSSSVTIEKLAYDQVLSAAQKEKGDPVLGGQLFVRQGCVACHTVKQSEAPKGSFLGDVAVRYNRSELVESILKPSAKVAQGFISHWFETRDGERYEGFIVREAGDEIELRNAAGIATVLPVKNVVKRGKLETSIMPEGLANNLTVEELASLLAYFESLKPK
jgi:putative membrane-bound dehydrogenase-like protein